MHGSQGPSRIEVLAVVGRSFLADIPAPLLDRILECAVVFRARAGEEFVAQEEPQRTAIMVTGLARVFVHLPDGREHSLRDLVPGAAAGIALPPGLSSPVSVRAIVESHVLELDTEALLEAAECEPPVGLAIAAECAKALHDTYLVIGSDAAGIRQRLARRLLDLAVDAGGWARVSHHELAHQLGCSREWVSRTLAAFRRDGIIATARDHISVRDRTRLQHIAHDMRPGAALFGVIAVESLSLL